MIPILVSLLLLDQPPQAPAAAATIRGRVMRTDGHPLPHATVRLMMAFGPIVNETTADEDGMFEFADVRPQQYRLIASKPGYVTLEFGQARASTRGEVVNLRAGETRERVDF